ncbi:hypothetical protein BDZ45DRAFT_182671 [Acephala macrosclerotiorum]|nr:hypothetical protein BDZ45DRAFT_182671 [Acephala macrosclerotiorum]
MKVKLNTSGTTRNSGINRHANSGDLSDDDVDLPPLEEVLKPKIASTLSNQGCKRKPASLTNLSDSDGGKSKRHCDRASRLAAASPGKSRPLKIIDLTTNTEHCALCPNVLGKGHGIKARMFVFTSCGCVVCGKCWRDKCYFQRSRCNGTSHYRCLKHAMPGQIVRKLFATDCEICLEDVADSQDRVVTKCGHSFCRGCIEPWINEQRSTCPHCRRVLPRGTAGLHSFRTVQRGVVREIES